MSEEEQTTQEQQNQPQTLSEQDKQVLDMAKLNRKNAVLEAEKAILNSQNVDLQYKYLVLQIYMKYGLTDQDTISDEGVIMRGGAIAKS